MHGPATAPPRTHLPIDDLRVLRTFVAVVAAQSFSRAARSLGMTPATVSKHISLLEDRLGVRLVNRTTRKLSITPIGATFYDRCVRILAEIEEAQEELHDLNSEPRGRLRMTAPAVLAVRHISPRLPQFLAAHPGMQVDLILTSRTVDLVNEAIDMALRVIPSAEPGPGSVVLVPNHRVFCAAPAYLDRHGVPQAPADLANHNCLLFQGTKGLTEWPIRDGAGSSSVRVRGNLVADNGEILRDAVIAGAGIAMLPTFLMGADIRAGRAVEVLADFKVLTTWIHAVVPHRRHIPRKARAMIDFIRGSFGSPHAVWDDRPLRPGAAS